MGAILFYVGIRGCQKKGMAAGCEKKSTTPMFWEPVHVWNCQLLRDCLLHIWLPEPCQLSQLWGSEAEKGWRGCAQLISTMFNLSKRPISSLNKPVAQAPQCPLACMQGSKCHHLEPRCFFHDLEKEGGQCFQSITISVIKLLYYTTQWQLVN